MWIELTSVNCRFSRTLSSSEHKPACNLITSLQYTQPTSASRRSEFKIRRLDIPNRAYRNIRYHERFHVGHALASIMALRVPYSFRIHKFKNAHLTLETSILVLQVYTRLNVGTNQQSLLKIVKQELQLLHVLVADI